MFLSRKKRKHYCNSVWNNSFDIALVAMVMIIDTYERICNQSGKSVVN